MPQTGLPNLGLQYNYDLGDSYKSGYDFNVVLSDSIGGGTPYVIDERSNEPASPAVGDAYILGPSPSGGNWSGNPQGTVAVYCNLGVANADPWAFQTPRTGWTLFDRNAGKWKTWDGAAWVNARQFFHAENRAETGSTTLQGSDDGAVLSFSALSGGATLTVPENSSVALPVGFTVTVWNRDAVDAVSFSTAGITWYGGAGGSGQPAALGEDNFAIIQKVAADEWLVVREV